MANRYEKEILGYSTIAVVIEDSIWEFGEEKEKAKINIPSLMPLQEPTSAVKITKITNGKISPMKIKKTQNFIELYLPDNLYTYPKEGTTSKQKKNSNILGSKEANGTGKKKKGKGLYRIVEKDTKLVITVVDGYAVEENIKILFKFDDFDNNNMGVKEKTKNALSKSSKAAALR